MNLARKLLNRIEEMSVLGMKSQHTVGLNMGKDNLNLDTGAFGAPTSDVQHSLQHGGVTHGTDTGILRDWLKQNVHPTGVTSRYHLNSSGFNDDQINALMAQGLILKNPHTAAALMVNMKMLNARE